MYWYYTLGHVDSPRSDKICKFVVQASDKIDALEKIDNQIQQYKDAVIIFNESFRSPNGPHEDRLAAYTSARQEQKKLVKRMGPFQADFKDIPKGYSDSNLPKNNHKKHKDKGLGILG